MKRNHHTSTITILTVVAALALAASAAAQSAQTTYEATTSAGPVKFTALQHASTRIEAGGKVIYVDPAKPYNFANAPKADLILISDIHGDHMDAEVVQTLTKAGTTVIAPAAVAQTITSAKVLANGQSTTWEGWTIEAIPAYNLTRGPQPGQLFHTKGRGNGYVLTYGGRRFYFSGDTEAVPEMRALQNIDVAFVCFNLPYTMTPEEAADGVKAFRPRVVIPYHYRGSDVNAFTAALQGSGVEVRQLNFYPGS